MPTTGQGPAPDANALTLLEWQKYANNPMYNAIVMSLYEGGSVLTDIPFKTNKTLTRVGSRFTGKNMPRVDFRKINDLPIGTKAVPEKFSESAYIIRNDIVVDRYLVEDTNTFQDPIAFEINAYLESVKYKYNDYFINNRHDGASDHNDAPVGIKERVSPTLGVDYGVQAGMLIDAGAVDISLANISQANASKFLTLIDRTLSAMGAPRGDGVKIYGNEIVLRLFANAIRYLPAGAGWSTTQDNYGRSVDKYRNAELVDLGRKDNQVEYIVNPYETTAGADATSVPTAATPLTYGTEAGTGKNQTSLYFVRYGEMYFSGWQFEPMKAQNFGKVTPPGTYYEVLFDWAGGLFMSNSRSLARLFDIKIGA